MSLNKFICFALIYCYALNWLILVIFCAQIDKYADKKRCERNLGVRGVLGLCLVGLCELLQILMILVDFGGYITTIY